LFFLTQFLIPGIIIVGGGLYHCVRIQLPSIGAEYGVCAEIAKKEPELDALYMGLYPDEAKFQELKSIARQAYLGSVGPLTGNGLLLRYGILIQKCPVLPCIQICLQATLQGSGKKFLI
jgi:hypothetical protein